MTLAILVLEDEPEVRTALARDLAQLAAHVRIELAEDVEDAHTVVDEIAADGDDIALILSGHRLPGTTGVDFLVASTSDERTRDARRVLVTGQAGQEDTIKAVNLGQLNHYIAKPWSPDDLRAVVRHELTEYVLANEIDPLSVLDAVDAPRVLRAMRQRPGGWTT